MFGSASWVQTELCGIYGTVTGKQTIMIALITVLD
jgi:hypothetical protein